MIHYLPECGSTNAELATRLRGGEAVAEGTWLVADRQTAGRGRQGREWLDAPGNFMGSTLVHRRFGDPDPASLALLAGLAVREAVLLHAPPLAEVVLKWPNDVMIGSAKLAGILLEAVGESVVIGLGVNLASAPELPDRQTATLQSPDRDRFAEDLARLFDLELDRWRSFGLAPVIGRWLAAAHPVGTPLCVGDAPGAPLHGTFAGLSEEGALLLRLADGGTRAIHAGEVRFA